MINIRFNFNENINKFNSHIGYGIRPTERRKGYNKINLYLGLMKAKELRLKKVKLNCENDNIGSIKTIIALGGILKLSEIDPSDNILTNVYYIDVDNSLKKYENIYKKYI